MLKISASSSAPSLPCAMKFWMSSCASAIGSPTGTPRRMRSLVFMVHGFGSVENGGRSVRTHSECEAVFVPFCRKDTAGEGLGSHDSGIAVGELRYYLSP